MRKTLKRGYDYRGTQTAADTIMALIGAGVLILIVAAVTSAAILIYGAML